MQIHHLIKHQSSRAGRRIGRGGKRGTYSGRGIKGQKARAGAKMRPAERELLKKIPKLRGYRFRSFQTKPAVINMHTLEKRFQTGDIVTPASLLRAGLIRRAGGRTPKVKILGRGELSKKLIFKDVSFSRPVAERLK